MEKFNDIFNTDKMFDGTPAEMARPVFDGTPAEMARPVFDGTPAEMERPVFDGTPAEMERPVFDGTPAEREVLEAAPSMEVQAMLIRDHFIETPELQYENWKDLTPEARLDALNGLENQIAQISMRPAMVLNAGEIPEGTLCQCAGKYPNTELIIDQELLADDSQEAYKATLNTLLREGRHAYQNYNLAGNEVEQNSALVSGWRMNYEELTGGYHDGSPDYNFEGDLKELQEIMDSDTPEGAVMRTVFGGFLDFSAQGIGLAKWSMQPVEMDAAVFAETVMDMLEL